MAESIIFVLIGGIAATVVIVVLGLEKWFDPRLLVFFFFLLLIPGLYAAFTTGPFVPSSRKRHQAMIKLAQLKPNHVIYDLGCGDGRFLFSAAPHVKKAIGYELSIPLVCYARLEKLFKRARNTEIRFGNIWNQNYSDADIIFCYLMPGAMKKIYKEIWPKLKPGARLITNAFQMHDLKPVEQEEGVYVYVR